MSHSAEIFSLPWAVLVDDKNAWISVWNGQGHMLLICASHCLQKSISETINHIKHKYYHRAMTKYTFLLSSQHCYLKIYRKWRQFIVFSHTVCYWSVPLVTLRLWANPSVPAEVCLVLLMIKYFLLSPFNMQGIYILYILK